MSLREKLHTAKVKLNLVSRLAPEGIESVRQRHSDFDSVRRRVQESGTDSLEYFEGGYTFEGGFYLQQNPDEFAALSLFLKERGPHTKYLEIGSASGGACLFLYREVGFHEVVSLDDGQHPRAQAQTEHFAQIKNFTQFIGDSHSREARRFLEETVAGTFDVAFIDGDHSYDGVWQDIQLTLPFCRPGTLIVLHDIIACEGVARAWSQAVRQGLVKPLAEFIGEEKPLGIAVGEVV